MKRSDRRDSNHDNAINHPQPKRQEPESMQDLKLRVGTLRANLKEEQTDHQATRVLYQEAQVYQPLYEEEKAKNSTLILKSEEASQKFQQYFSLYSEEKTQNNNLILQVQAAQAETEKYLTLYNASQAELKTERHSKAGIKGWETRRKKENDRLKQEIAEMVLLLRDSMERKEEAMANLENLADRMDRIQSLVGSVEEDSTTATPLGMIAKFKRIWRAIQEILAE
jgi:hypothetical protein